MKSFFYSDKSSITNSHFGISPMKSSQTVFFRSVLFLFLFFSHPEKLIIFHISHFDGGKRCISFEQLFVFLLQSYAEMSLVVLPFAYLQVQVLPTRISNQQNAKALKCSFSKLETNNVFMEVCNNLNFWVSFKDNENIKFIYVSSCDLFLKLCLSQCDYFRGRQICSLYS